jgi:hypothetical protein
MSLVFVVLVKNISVVVALYNKIIKDVIIKIADVTTKITLRFDLKN